MLFASLNSIWLLPLLHLFLTDARYNKLNRLYVIHKYDQMGIKHDTTRIDTLHAEVEHVALTIPVYECVVKFLRYIKFHPRISLKRFLDMSNAVYASVGLEYGVDFDFCKFESMHYLASCDNSEIIWQMKEWDWL